MRNRWLLAIVATCMIAVDSMAVAPVPAARAAVEAMPFAQLSGLTVQWPSGALTWNEQGYLFVKVQPKQAGRTVRLDLWGQGGPGWSEIDRQRTDPSGGARLALFTLCPDMPCKAITDRYRVVLLPTKSLTGTIAHGSVKVVP